MIGAFTDLLGQLRAAAEPTRLRMLAILSRGEFSVGELTQVLGQSQPRVSRHLKLLDDCGLLERFREQHWIYYRVPADSAGGRLVRQLLSGVDAADPVLAQDAVSVAALLEQRARRGGVPTDADLPRPYEPLARALGPELGDPPVDALLYFGSAPAGMIAPLTARARRIVGMHPDRTEVQRARASLHSRGYSHCVLQQGGLRSLPHASASFDVALLDGALLDDPRPGTALREVGRVLRPGGRLLLIEDYDALDARCTADHPLSRVRDWLAEAGLACLRLRPIDLEGAHVLLAVAATQPAAGLAA